MNWVKKGLIFSPENLGGWRSHTFITPTPYLVSDEVIRIYGGFRDEMGVSRIGFIDVEASNPAVILRVSDIPALDIGKEGMFDDNGVILGSILSDGNGIRMYYVGFQLVQKVKFLAFSGLAVSNDHGETFQRISNTPILDRYREEYYIRAIHTVIKKDGKYQIWYSAGHRWEYINNVPYPQYKIMYTESSDGIIMPLKEGANCIDVINDEYRIGRPTTFFEDGIYKMFYTKDTFSKKYSSGYAESKDGIHWTRKENEFNLQPSAEGWDSEMICYPIPISTKYGRYLFYSGNNMGQSGVGYAKLENEQ